MNEEQQKRNEELAQKIRDMIENPENNPTEKEERLVIMTLSLPKICWLIVEGEANSRGVEPQALLASMLEKQVVLSQAMTVLLFEGSGGLEQ